MADENRITHGNGNEVTTKRPVQAANPVFSARFTIPLNGSLNEPGTAIMMYKIEGEAILETGEPHNERGTHIVGVDYAIEGSISGCNMAGLSWTISHTGRFEVLSGGGCTIMRPMFPLRQGTNLFLRLCFSITSDSARLVEMTLERHVSRTKTDERAKTTF